MVVFAPFASSLPAPNFDDTVDFEIWYESVIVAQNEVWDDEMWKEVSMLWPPLRTLDEERLLVWRTDNFELNQRWSVIGLNMLNGNLICYWIVRILPK